MPFLGGVVGGVVGVIGNKMDKQAKEIKESFTRCRSGEKNEGIKSNLIRKYGKFCFLTHLILLHLQKPNLIN